MGSFCHTLCHDTLNSGNIFLYVLLSHAQRHLIQLIKKNVKRQIHFVEATGDLRLDNWPFQSFDSDKSHPWGEHTVCKRLNSSYSKTICTNPINPCQHIWPVISVNYRLLKESISAHLLSYAIIRGDIKVTVSLTIHDRE